MANGFDIEWATRHQAKSGKQLVVQAGVGSRAPVVDVAAYERAAEAADPFAPVDTSAGAVLVLPYPVSANVYWATRVYKDAETHQYRAMTYVTKDAEAYKVEVQRRALLARVRPIKGRIELDIQLFPAQPQDWEKRAAKDPMNWDDDVRCIDLDNANKVLLDALKGVVMEDDKWVRKLHAERMEPDKHGARVVVTIKPIVRVDPRGSLF